jgi:hypothetical protein
MKEHFYSVLQVGGINLGAITMYLANINQILTGVSLLSAIAYTLFKLYKEIKRK